MLMPNFNNTTHFDICINEGGQENFKDLFTNKTRNKQTKKPIAVTENHDGFQLY